MERFTIKRNIHALSSREAVTFAHNRGFARFGDHTLHLNDCIEIYIFIEGDVHYVIEDEYFVLNRGDILVIPPRSIHVPIIKSECEYERFYMLFPRESLADYLSSPLDALMTKEKGAGLRLSLDDEQRSRALSILYRMSEICKTSGGEWDSLTLHALSLEFLCVLCESDDRGAVSDIHLRPQRPLPELIKNVLTYISTSAPDVSGAADIAQKFNISAPYLSSVFKQYVGVTVNSYLRAKKIAVAKELLRDGNSVSYACYASGFSDSSYFIKVFKACTGVTPKKYKDEN